MAEKSCSLTEFVGTAIGDTLGLVIANVDTALLDAMKLEKRYRSIGILGARTGAGPHIMAADEAVKATNTEVVSIELPRDTKGGAGHGSLIILGGNDVSDVKRGIEVALKELDRTFGDVYGNEAGHIELQYTARASYALEKAFGAPIGRACGIIVGAPASVGVLMADTALKSANVEVVAYSSPAHGTSFSNEAILVISGDSGAVRQAVAELTNKPSSEIFIQDLLAVDTSVPVSVTGGLAGEFSLEQAVGIASMVKSDRLQMAMIAREIEQKLNIDVQIGGAEAEAAILGALTTPGTTRPLAILDLGAGSTDASIINPKGEIIATHLAGAGDMVTMIIARELGLEDRYLAEEIKKYPLAKVESLFHLRHEDGSVQFFPTPLPPTVFARVCVVKPDELVPLPGDLALEKVRAIRRSAKERVFVTNALRALRQVSPTGNIRDIPFVVLVGGSSLDFEVPQLVTDALAHYRLVAGRGNIRGSEGPRNAVATGLILSWHKEFAHGQ
ncbi:hypothetical protein CC479_19895 [Salmonella enterica subsp. enterica serovar Newport]|nr:hypothetical protein [Salmonella enterica subsp. enterica serovar Newport]